MMKKQTRKNLGGARSTVITFRAHQKAEDYSSAQIGAIQKRHNASATDRNIKKKVMGGRIWSVDNTATS